MKAITEKLILAVMSIFICMNVFATDITGAGATFPYPIYAKWAESYAKQTGDRLNYQSIGSGGGIKQIKANTVDFGASDKPLSASDLESSGLIQFPMILGGVVPVINVEGVQSGQLKLSGKILADIYLGKISRWDDPQILALNPDLSLPSQSIAVIYRADGSGTSFLWTDFLSKTSADFKTQVGSGTSVKWPSGIGAKGNEGVAANVQRIKGSIGYVEYAYTKRNKIAYVQLLNNKGKFVQPNEASFKEAAAQINWNNTPGFGVILTNGSGWPITGASFILMKKIQNDPQKGKAILKFFDWSFDNGSKAASELDYVMLPQSVMKQIRKVWKTSLTDASGNPIWK